MSESDIGVETKSIVVKDWTIEVTGEFGWFEHETGGGGGLWFEGIELIDYDGCYALNHLVIQGLRQLGYTVSNEFE